MNCRSVRTSLAEDLLSRVDEEIAAHLEECEECRAVCRDLMEIEELSRSLGGRVGVPEGFREAVLSKAARKAPARVFRLGAALAGMVLLAASVGLFQGGDSPEPGILEVEPEPRHVELEGTGSIEPAYVDVLVTGDGNETFILRLPSVIEVRRTELQEDFYIANVSH